MKTLMLPPGLVNGRSLRTMLVLGLAALAGCVAGGGYDGGYYDGGASVDYGVGFYEPYGYEYGGWGPGYRVGPPRGGYDRGGYDHDGRGDDRGGRGEGHGAPHPAYRPAAPSRPMPSLPSHGRGR